MVFNGIEDDEEFASKAVSVGLDSQVERAIRLGYADNEITLSEIREKSEAVLDYLRENHPSRFFIPNAGQEKAIAPLKKMDRTELPFMQIVFAGGNGVGKTTVNVASVLAGAIWGISELNEFFHDWDFFHLCKNVTRKRKEKHIRIRIVCSVHAMKQDGQMFEEIRTWWPKGLYKWSKNQCSYFSQCECFDLNGTLVATIQVRTFDQDRIAHAGSNLDLIVSDEPLPEELYAENVGRLRSGGIMAMFCTPLDIGGWIKDRLSDDVANVHFTTAPIWDNCIDYHPDPRMWDSGIVGQGKVMTRGHLRKAKIDAMIHEWMKEGPEVARARELGEFTHLSGAIMKEWDPGTHMIEPFKIPRNWPIYCVMDPHNARPPFAAWFAHSPDDDLYLIAEYPPVPWQSAKGGENVSTTGKGFREVEKYFRSQVIFRLSDPALGKFKTQAQTEEINLKTEFAKEGFHFIDANNEFDVGMSRLRGRLLYDRGKPVTQTNRPSFYIMTSNPYSGEPIINVPRAMNEWVYKKGAYIKASDGSASSKVQEAWKDPIDVCRYVCSSVKKYRDVGIVGIASALDRVKRICRNPRSRY